MGTAARADGALRTLPHRGESRLDAAESPQPQASPAQGDRLTDDGPQGTLRSDLFSVNGHILGCFDTDPNLIPVNLDDGHQDVVADDNLLSQLPAQNQHDHLPVDVRYSIFRSRFLTIEALLNYLASPVPTLFK
jgi:hypothetical protein